MSLTFIYCRKSTILLHPDVRMARSGVTTKRPSCHDQNNCLLSHNLGCARIYSAMRRFTDSMGATITSELGKWTDILTKIDFRCLQIFIARYTNNSQQSIEKFRRSLDKYIFLAVSMAVHVVLLAALGKSASNRPNQKIRVENWLPDAWCTCSAIIVVSRTDV